MVTFQDSGQDRGKANGGVGSLFAGGLPLENSNIRAKHVVSSRDITALLQLTVPSDVLVKPGFEILACRNHEGFLEDASLFNTGVVSFGVFRALIFYSSNQRNLGPGRSSSIGEELTNIASSKDMVGCGVRTGNMKHAIRQAVRHIKTKFLSNTHGDDVGNTIRTEPDWTIVSKHAHLGDNMRATSGMDS
jgi:hypothetical protein